MLEDLMRIPDINVNAQNDEGDTPLHIAARMTRTFMVEALLRASHGTINMRNKRNQTLLDVAIEKGNQEMEVFLRDRGGLRWNEVMQFYL
jgi:ankyrin repeat protein